MFKIIKNKFSEAIQWIEGRKSALEESFHAVCDELEVLVKRVEALEAKTGVTAAIPMTSAQAVVAVAATQEPAVVAETVLAVAENVPESETPEEKE